MVPFESLNVEKKTVKDTQRTLLNLRDKLIPFRTILKWSKKDTTSG